MRITLKLVVMGSLLSMSGKAAFPSVIYDSSRVDESKVFIHRVSADIKELESIRLVKAAGALCAREELSVMSERHTPTVALPLGSYRRGGRFNGCPLGLVVIDSYPYCDPGFKRPLLLIDAVNKTIALQKEKMSWGVAVGDKIIELDRVNQPALDNEVVAYNSLFGSETCTSVGGIELVIDRGQLIQIRNFWGSGPLSRQGYVIRIGAQHPLSKVNWREYLGKPCTPSIKTASLDLERDGIFAIQGLMMLVEKGEVVGAWENQLVEGGLPQRLADEVGINLNNPQARASFINASNAYAAIGLTAEGIIKIVVAEGKGSADEPGLTLNELSEVMKKEGCISAMLAASGADVGLWVRGKMVTAPGGNDQLEGHCEECPISTALLMVE